MGFKNFTMHQKRSIKKKLYFSPHNKHKILALILIPCFNDKNKVSYLKKITKSFKQTYDLYDLNVF